MSTSDKIKINGVAHTILTVSSIEKSRAFYMALCKFFGLTCVSDTEVFIYFVGGRTAIGIESASEENQKSGDRFDQQRVGLHHTCWRCYSKEDIDKFYVFAVKTLVPLGGKIVRKAEEGPYAPGYYSVLFEDPDGIRLEVNHVPGAGLLGLKDPKIQGGYDIPPKANL